MVTDVINHTESIGRFCPRARTVKKKMRLSLFDLVCFSLFFKHGILAFRIAIVLYFVFFLSTCTYRPANYESRPDMVDLLLLIMSALTLFYYHCVSLTPEIVYQACGRTMTDRTHEVGIS